VNHGEALALASRRTAAEERICSVAGGDLSPLEGPAQLDRQTYRLVQIAALVALDGPLVSWVAQLDAADEAQLDLEQVLGALVALAPIVGTPRVVSAGAKIVRATALTEAD
jgi:alkylhydroperoxidase/carboxymuconolactone decarboxylase family protein YurZ